MRQIRNLVECHDVRRENFEMLIAAAAVLKVTVIVANFNCQLIASV